MSGAIWQPVQLSMTEPRLPKYRDRVNAFEYFGGDNLYDLPQLAPEQIIPNRLVPWIATDYTDAAVHFFLDDYRFEAAWNDPPATLARLGTASAVLAPDFSLWREMPFPVQLWQVYRSRWLGAYWQSRGLRVIPSVEWTHPFDDWMLDGLPEDGVLAVQVFNKPDDLARRTFEAGYRAMEERLRPACVLVYGDLPIEPRTEIREFPTFVHQNRARLT